MGAREAAKYVANNVHTPAANTGLQTLARNLRYADKENRDRIAGLLKCVVNDACNTTVLADPADPSKNKELIKDIDGFSRDKGKLVQGTLGANKPWRENLNDYKNILKAPFKGYDQTGAIQAWEKTKTDADNIRSIKDIRDKIGKQIRLLDKGFETNIGMLVLGNSVNDSKLLKETYVALRALRKTDKMELPKYEKVLEKISNIQLQEIYEYSITRGNIEVFLTNADRESNTTIGHDLLQNIDRVYPKVSLTELDMLELNLTNTRTETDYDYVVNTFQTNKLNNITPNPAHPIRRQSTPASTDPFINHLNTNYATAPAPAPTNNVQPHTDTFFALGGGAAKPKAAKQRSAKPKTAKQRSAKPKAKSTKAKAKKKA